MPSTVGIRDLKDRLSAYLRLVKRGATILVTDRGRPVAQLRPVPSTATDLEARLQELAAQGVVSLPTRKGLRDLEPLRLDGPPLSRTLLEDREDRL